jgi:RNA polymerase sigma factor for flagellar operon FliA
MTTVADRTQAPVAQTSENRAQDSWSPRKRQRRANRPVVGRSAPTTNSPIDRQQRAVQHIDLVRSIAHRLHARLPRSVDVNDLINVGIIGLMEAIDRYDDTRSVPFEVFAKPRIQGAIVDELRSQDWVPRTVRRRAELINDTKENLSRRLGRTPNREEMAKAIDVSTRDYDRMVRNSQVRSVLSLDTPTHAENPTPLIDQLSDDSDMLDDWQQQELKAVVVDAIRRLPERERTAVRMYYLEERPLLEVGEALGVSESRASQLHRRGIERLKFKIRDYLAA